MTQEHGRMEPISGSLDYSKYPLGTMLTLIPYHVSIPPSLVVKQGLFASLPDLLTPFFSLVQLQRCILFTMCTLRVIWWGSGSQHEGGEWLYFFVGFFFLFMKPANKFQNR